MTDPREEADAEWGRQPRQPRQPRQRAGNGPSGKLHSRALFWPQLRDLPDPDYLIKGVVERGAFVEIYGPHSSGKSFFGCDMGLLVAAGRPWRGRRVKQGGVLYVAAEGGINIKRRLDAFARHHGVDLAKLPVAVVLAPTDLSEPAGVAQLIVDAKAVPDIALIIIDTAARTMPGGKEDTEDMGRFVAACDEIRLATGAAVAVIHHTGKDIGRGSRGSIVLPAAVDTIIAVTANDKIFSAAIEKARDGEIGATFSFTLKVIDLGQDSDGDPITSCVVEPLGDAGATGATRHAKGKAQPKLADGHQVALDVLRNAMSHDGRLAPASRHIPANVTVISYDTWRRFYLTTTSGDDLSEATRRKALSRARDSLLSKKIIGIWNEMVWEL